MARSQSLLEKWGSVENSIPLDVVNPYGIIVVFCGNKIGDRFIRVSEWNRILIALKDYRTMELV